MKKKTLIAAGIFLCSGPVCCHEHKPPHGGTLIELGEEFAHVELKLDAGEGKLTAYVLDGEAEYSIRLTQLSLDFEVGFSTTGNVSTATLSLLPVANPLTGETASDTSEYTTTSTTLRGVKRFSGMIEAIKVRGSAFSKVSFRYPEGNE